MSPREPWVCGHCEKPLEQHVHRSSVGLFYCPGSNDQQTYLSPRNVQTYRSARDMQAWDDAAEAMARRMTRP
jgi:hypothetical protein